MPGFVRPSSGLELERPILPGAFFDVVGRRSAVFGSEGGSFEAWVYPLKILDDFQLSFRLEGYPLDIDGRDVAASIAVSPEASVLTYAHAAFTVRQILFAPIDEPGIVMLLEIDASLPMTITGSFRPRLKLMWPAGLMTANVAWDESQSVYSLTEETQRFAAVIGSPGARDVSLMPYQEEPRDVPLRFVLPLLPEEMRSHLVPIVIAGSLEGRDGAKRSYDRLLGSARELYETNVAHYRSLLERTLTLSTPDPRLDTAFAWAKVGIDKGLATNPLLGTGLVAGFRTSGESERPGFAWLFGRDALWTAFALNAYGDFEATRTALDFLRKHQRDDGKIPHEISQSAGLIPWFSDYAYPWNAADATPLYVIAHADHWRASGDLDFLKASWDSILEAFRFTLATDTDGNGLVENTEFGHGWVEGGALYPPHEEIYLQGVWIEAARRLAELAEVVGDAPLAAEARAAAERTRAATERVYWLEDRGFYGFASTRPRKKPSKAEPGPHRAVRQERLDELREARFIDENTVLPAVALWWRGLEDGRAQSQIDHLGSGALATDWGTRLLSNRSRLYDPISYHNGSVWPLFTGWAAMAAYRYGRPHVGYQALMANALLTEPGALGYVTELLSGDFNAAFGRSSHHQIWSEAMVVTPLVRGLLGLEASAGGRTLRFAPQLPADWDRVSVGNVALGDARFDLTLTRGDDQMTIRVEPAAQGPLEHARGKRSPTRLEIAPAFPLDARIHSATVDGRPAPFELSPLGDVQHAEVVVELAGASREIVFRYDEGTGVYFGVETPAPGARSEGLRVLRARATGDTLHLLVEGRGGRAYSLGVRTPRRMEDASGASVERSGPRDWQLRIAFEGPPEDYVRRELALPLHGLLGGEPSGATSSIPR